MCFVLVIVITCMCACSNIKISPTRGLRLEVTGRWNMNARFLGGKRLINCL